MWTASQDLFFKQSFVLVDHLTSIVLPDYFQFIHFFSFFLSLFSSSFPWGTRDPPLGWIGSCRGIAFLHKYCQVKSLNMVLSISLKSEKKKSFLKAKTLLLYKQAKVYTVKTTYSWQVHNHPHAHIHGTSIQQCISLSWNMVGAHVLHLCMCSHINSFQAR